MPPASRGLPPESPPTLLVLFPTAPAPLEDLRAVLLEVPHVDKLTVHEAIDTLASQPRGSFVFQRVEHRVRRIHTDERQGLQRKGVYAVYDLLLRMFEGRTGQ